MALSSKSRRRGLMAEINVVPYIDVMLVLVVILMVAAPFVNPSVVNLPSVNKASKAPEKVVEVVVYPDGRLSLRAGKEMQPTDMPGLVAAVRSAQAGDAKVPVVIAADKWGKIKTISQMIWLNYTLLMLWLFPGAGWAHTVFVVLMGIVVATTVLSGANYMLKNKELYSDR